MTYAMLLANEFGLTHIGIKRIWAITSQQNEKAIKLLERNNFKRIRVLNDNEVEFEFVSKASMHIWDSNKVFIY